MELQSITCRLVRQGLVLQLHSAEQTKKKILLIEEIECHFFQLLLLNWNPELWGKVIDKET